jgi:hypothetical protein
MVKLIFPSFTYIPITGKIALIITLVFASGRRIIQARFQRCCKIIVKCIRKEI